MLNLSNNDYMISYEKSENILSDMQEIIEATKKHAYNAVNIALIQRNWLIGYRIFQEELKGEDRADYGNSVIKELSKELTAIYGKGFTKTNLYNYYSFYKKFPEIFHSLSGKSLPLLSWTHYRILLQVNDSEARE